MCSRICLIKELILHPRRTSFTWIRFARPPAWSAWSYCTSNRHGSSVHNAQHNCSTSTTLHLPVLRSYLGTWFALPITDLSHRSPIHGWRPINNPGLLAQPGMITGVTAFPAAVRLPYIALPNHASVSHAQSATIDRSISCESGFNGIMHDTLSRSYGCSEGWK